MHKCTLGTVCCLLLFSFQGSFLLSQTARQPRGQGRGEDVNLINPKLPVNNFLFQGVRFTVTLPVR